jgi:hypothetical protein
VTVDSPDLLFGALEASMKVGYTLKKSTSGILAYPFGRESIE